VLAVRLAMFNLMGFRVETLYSAQLPLLAADLVTVIK
jgi:hypothetical protein